MIDTVGVVGHRLLYDAEGTRRAWEQRGGIKKILHHRFAAAGDLADLADHPFGIVIEIRGCFGASIGTAEFRHHSWTGEGIECIRSPCEIDPLLIDRASLFWLGFQVTAAIAVDFIRYTELFRIRISGLPRAVADRRAAEVTATTPAFIDLKGLAFVDEVLVPEHVPRYVAFWIGDVDRFGNWAIGAGIEAAVRRIELVAPRH